MIFDATVLCYGLFTETAFYPSLEWVRFWNGEWENIKKSNLYVFLQCFPGRPSLSEIFNNFYARLPLPRKTMFRSEYLSVVQRAQVCVYSKVVVFNRLDDPQPSTRNEQVRECTSPWKGYSRNDKCSDCADIRVFFDIFRRTWKRIHILTHCRTRQNGWAVQAVNLITEGIPVACGPFFTL